MRPGKFLWILWAVLATAGCGSDDEAADAADAADGARDEGPDGHEEAGCTSEAGTVDLTGTWAARAWIHVYLVTPGEGIVRLCPDRWFGVNVITLRVVVDEQSGTRVRHRFNLCRMDIPVVDAAVDPGCESTVRMAMAVGPALTAQWPSIDYPGGATLGSTDGCASYRSEPLEMPFGVDDTVGITDPLPTWRAGCEGTADRCVDGFEHVVDDDGDGNPGVTLTVRSEPEELIDGRVFATFRTVATLRGEAWSSDLVLGVVDPSMDYQLVDSDVQVAGGLMPPWFVRENIPVFEIPASGSTFVLVRADGRGGAPNLDADGSGEVTCAEILAAESVFAPYQP